MIFLAVDRARLPQIYKNYTDKSCEGMSCSIYIYHDWFIQV